MTSTPTAAVALRPVEAERDSASPNRNLTPVTTALDPEGRLVVGGCLLSDLARRYGTPLYVLDEATLRGTAQAYRHALASHYPGAALALYASKANSSLAITALVADEGLGLDAVSAGELLTAVQGGMPPERIVFHGNNKSAEELRLAVDLGVTVVADNWLDLELLEALSPSQPVRLMLRFTPGIECHTHEYIRTGHLDSKFGFDPDQLEAVLQHLKGCPWAQVTGLHAHIGSQIFELQPHRDLAAVMADALQRARELGHPVSDLNVGGGLGIRYVESDDPPSIDAWVRTVAEAVAAACQERGLELPRLLCEPGRSSRTWPCPPPPLAMCWRCSPPVPTTPRWPPTTTASRGRRRCSCTTARRSWSSGVSSQRNCCATTFCRSGCGRYPDP